MEKAIVVDTNIIFSSLLANASIFRDALLESDYIFYAPNYIVAELFKHKEKIRKFSKLTEDELLSFFNEIIERVRFVPLDFISIETRQTAYDLCKNVDLKDIPFVALAIELNIPIWTNDKKLKEGLLRKGYSDFFSLSA